MGPLEFASVLIAVGILFGLGRLLATNLPRVLAASLSSRWVWLGMPLTAIICFTTFAVLRPFLLDQPRTPTWYLAGVIAVAAVYAGAVTLARTIIQAFRSATGPSDTPRVERVVSILIMVSVVLVIIWVGIAVATHRPGMLPF